jgi:ectoine hydroxylase-related dioxygenase (phytanoyl-CoA dioxygenase family)
MMHALQLTPQAHPSDPLTGELQREGYVVLRSIASADQIAQLHEDLKERFAKTPFCAGDFYGRRTKRFGSLLKRSSHVADLVMHRTILGLADSVLGPFCDRVQLNLTQALEIHPGEVRQHPHRDQDMYRAPAGAAEYLFNVMWPFSPYTRENGATLIYPRSNHLPYATEYDLAAATAVEMSPGDALVFLGSTLHGAGANITDQPRTGMIVGYSLGWLKPYENQWLAYPPHVAREFAPELAALVGYCEHRPNLGNYEGQCPSVLLHDHTPDFLAAADNVREEQRARLSEFRSAQTRACLEMVPGGERV